MKFAILHVDQAVEMLLKERVRVGHKSILKNPKETISIWDSYRILEEELNVTIPERPDLELLHEERNQIQHKYANPSAEDTAFHIEKAVLFIRRFLKEELGTDMDGFVSSEHLSQIILDKDVKIARSQSEMSERHLAEILLGTPFRLYFNPAVSGLSMTKVMRFGEKGVIARGANKNEASWRIRNNLLELLNSEGQVFSRFYFSSSDNRFCSTNDSDTKVIQERGIRNQYMVPEV
jgi:hypothetical protein